jgi:hypothetical protein
MSEQTETVEPTEQSEMDKLRERVRQLENLVEHDPSLAAVFSLNASCSGLLALFMSAGFLTQRQIAEQLKYDTPPKLLVHRLRKRLAQFGIEIDNKRNIGWMLTPEMKAQVEKAMKEFAV